MFEDRRVQRMRIASAEDLGPASARFAEVRPRLSDRYHVELTDHPIAGLSLQHYLLLTECPELVAGLGLSESERRWSQYYWLARFAKEWQAVAGEDAGLEQMVFQLLEHMDTYEPAEEVMVAVERDAVIRPR
jgi:hypothetical protein